jgi:PTH1 family peptidyl-tRNA hydrolase
MTLLLPDAMIKLIVGLGNPGRQYQNTRHNVGFLFLDELLNKTGGNWSNDAKFHGLTATLDKTLLLKPGTFMNKSGLSVGKLARFYKISPEEILVVHDELDFNPGIVRLKKDGGHGGHNGLRDIIDHLGSKDFYRLRIGIGRPQAGKVVADYVLSAPDKKDWQLIESAFTKSLGYLEQMLSGDMATVMNQLNA